MLLEYIEQNPRMIKLTSEMDKLYEQLDSLSILRDEYGIDVHESLCNVECKPEDLIQLLLQYKDEEYFLAKSKKA